MLYSMLVMRHSGGRPIQLDHDAGEPLGTSPTIFAFVTCRSNRHRDQLWIFRPPITWLSRNAWPDNSCPRALAPLLCAERDHSSRDYGAFARVRCRSIRRRMARVAWPAMERRARRVATAPRPFARLPVRRWLSRTRLL